MPLPPLPVLSSMRVLSGEIRNRLRSPTKLWLMLTVTPNKPKLVSMLEARPETVTVNWFLEASSLMVPPKPEKLWAPQLTAANMKMPGKRAFLRKEMAVTVLIVRISKS